MGHKLNINDIGQLLDRSTSQLDAATLHKLQLARRTALKHQRSKETSSVLAWIGVHSPIHHDSSHNHRAFNVGVVTLFAILLLAGLMFWQDMNDHSDVDISILTDDLPVEMYVD